MPNRAAFGYFSGMKRFATILGLVLVVVLPSARAQQSPDDQYIAIYNQVQQADTLQASGQPQQALADYTQALAALQKFQKIFPEWDAAIVTYRLDYLAEKIKTLTAQLPAPPQNTVPTNTPPSSAPPNAVASAAPMAANAAPAAAVADAEMQLNALRAQVQNLQAENEVFQARLKEALRVQPATADTPELSKARAQILSLMKENDLLRASPVVVVTNAASPAELPRLRQALADANKKLAEQTRLADKLAQENQKLQSDAGVSRLEKTALEKRLQQRQTAAETDDETKTLRARLAVDEAQAVPYTPEELALLKSPAPVPAAAVNDRSQEKSVKELPGGSAALVAEAQKYFSNGDYDKAEADYRQILQRDPANALALANLAAIELQENKLSDADTHITAALAKNPDDAYTLSTFGYLKFRQEKFDEALDALSRAAKLEPANPQIQNYLGVTLSHKGLHAQAETALRKAIQLDPGYGAAHNNLAVVYLGAKPPAAQLARWHYQKALDLGQPRNSDLEKLLAELGAPVAQ